MGFYSGWKIHRCLGGHFDSASIPKELGKAEKLREALGYFPDGEKI